VAHRARTFAVPSRLQHFDVELTTSAASLASVNDAATTMATGSPTKRTLSIASG